MFSINALLFALSSVGTLAAPSVIAPNKDANTVTRRGLPNGQGTNNGFFYSSWSDNTGNVDYENGDAGQYSLTWSGTGDVVSGKGFNPGAPRIINYQADYQPSSEGYSFLSVYGWFKNPLTEYYICESWGQGNPGGGDGMIHKGSFESDGGTYDVFQHQQVDAPSIEGTTNFMQYWSIRTEKRTSGSVNTSAHYEKWASLGMPIGTFDYQIVATEGVKSESSGKSSVTVTDGGLTDGSDSGSSPAASSSASAPAASSASVASAPYAPAPSAESSAPAAPSVVAPSESPYVPSAQTTSTAAAATTASTEAAAPTVPAEASTVPSVPSAGSAPLGGAGGTPGSGTPTPGAGYTPGAGFPYGGYPGSGATPTPHSGHHHHHPHHAFGSGYPRFPGFPRPGGAPNPASQALAPSATAEAAPSESSDDC